MIAKELFLENFRNYKNQKISLSEGVNVFYGKNAQGKTNILEAIYFLSITKSFLSVNEKTLIYRNKDFSRVCIINSIHN